MDMKDIYNTYFPLIQNLFQLLIDNPFLLTIVSTLFISLCSMSILNKKGLFSYFPVCFFLVICSVLLFIGISASSWTGFFILIGVLIVFLATVISWIFILLLNKFPISQFWRKVLAWGSRLLLMILLFSPMGYFFYGYNHDSEMAKQTAIEHMKKQYHIDIVVYKQLLYSKSNSQKSYEILASPKNRPDQKFYILVEKIIRESRFEITHEDYGSMYYRKAKE